MPQRQPDRETNPPDIHVAPPPAEGAHHTRNRNLLIGAVLVAIILLILFLRHRASANEKKAETAAAGARDRAVPVGVAPVVARDVPVYLDGLGNINALNTVTVKTRIDGQLLRFNFQEGQVVRAGEELALIDPGPSEAQLAQAEATRGRDVATLQNAERDLQRYADLYKAGVIPQQQYNTQQSAVRVNEATIRADEAQIQQARLNVQYCHIKAPITGRVGIRAVDPGNMVHASDQNGLVVITQMQPIAALFTLPEDELQAVNQHMHAGAFPVEAWSRDGATKLATGRLLTIDNQIDPNTGTFRCKAVFDNADGALFPNQFINARMQVDTKRQALTIPTAAVQHGSVGTYVYVVTPEKTADMRPVQVVLSEGTTSVVTGVNDGEQVVTEGADKLQPKGKVQVGRSAGGTSMNPSRLFILRPVATSLLMVAILLAGLIAFRELPVSALPQVDYPTIQVLTFYPGASPDVMTSSVTAPMERQFGQIPGLQQMSSTSSFGGSMITLQFDLKQNIDVAEQSVQAAINAAGTFLPRDLPNPPIYSKVNPADTPILTLALTSNQLPLSKVEDLADTTLAQKISQLPGVGLVTISGGQKPAVRVQANPSALASYGLSLEDLRTGLAAANTDQAKGNLQGPQQSFSIGANDQIFSSGEYKPVIIAYRNGAPVRVSDVARVVDGVEDVQKAAWKNTTPAVIMNVQRQPGANIINVVDRIEKLLPQLTNSLPPSVKVTVLTDRTVTIRASVHDVEFELLLTIALVVLVIFLFLRRVSATVIPSVAVPLSIVGTFGVMYLLGYSLDNLSLMALTISTGFVVDDAIVMIENITRFIEEGHSPLEAALMGSKQIGFTIVSLTVSLIAVLIPLLFMADIVGRLFREFAVTLSVTILVSAVVSLTLTPMMSARLLRPESETKKQSRFFAKSEELFERVIAFYGRTLQVVLRHQTITLLVTLATLVVTILLYIVVPKGFFPVQDTGVILGISEAPEDVSFAAMAERQLALTQIVTQDPAVASVSSFIGVDGTNVTSNVGRIQINLKPLDERDANASEVIRRLQPKLADVAGITLHMQPVQDLSVESRVSRTQYQYTLEDANATELAQWVPRIVAELQKLPELRDVASDQGKGSLEAELVVDRNTASRLGVTPQMIDDTLYDAFGQRQVSTIFTQLNQYHVVLEADPKLQLSPDALQHIYVHASPGSAPSSGGATAGSVGAAAASQAVLNATTPSTPSAAAGTASVPGTTQPVAPLSGSREQIIPLSSFAHIETHPTQVAVNHLGQFPVATISFNLAPNESLGAATKRIDETVAQLGLPPSIHPEFQGTAAVFRSSLANEGWLILAALITVYIVLGVLYESYIHPITILSTLPSAGVGAILALMLFGMELGVVALIGIILLIGIVKKNAIMMIDFALEAEREQGKSAEEAIYQACLLRFRPIMMTTFAALFGGLPLALGRGTGAELRHPLGVTIVGGLLVSQVLTLYTTPVVYLWFDRLAQRVRRRVRVGNAVPA